MDYAFRIGIVTGRTGPVAAGSRRGYSTVTLLARFRGLSMSQPRSAGDVVGEELERDDGQERLDDLGDVGDRQEDVGDRGGARRRPRCRRR